LIEIQQLFIEATEALLAAFDLIPQGSVLGVQTRALVQQGGDRALQPPEIVAVVLDL
jgi:hypothetical protein